MGRAGDRGGARTGRCLHLVRVFLAEFNNISQFARGYHHGM
jgi:hypothetical protein